MQVAPAIEAETESKDSKEPHAPKACSGILAGAMASMFCFSAQARMDMMKWMVAFEMYALAAEAAEVWTYTSAKAHLRICQQIACELLSSSCRRLALRVAAFAAEVVRQMRKGAISSLRCTMSFAAKSGMSVRPGVRQVSAPSCFAVLACSSL